jgi:hypothetical protein
MVWRFRTDAQRILRHTLCAVRGNFRFTRKRIVAGTRNESWLVNAGNVDGKRHLPSFKTREAAEHYRARLLERKALQSPSALSDLTTLAAAGVRGELRINTTRWQTNEKQNTNESAELQLRKCLTYGVMALVHEISRLARKNNVAHRFVESLEECRVPLFFGTPRQSKPSWITARGTRRPESSWRYSQRWLETKLKPCASVFNRDWQRPVGGGSSLADQ